MAHHNSITTAEIDHQITLPNHHDYQPFKKVQKHIFIKTIHQINLSKRTQDPNSIFNNNIKMIFQTPATFNHGNRVFAAIKKVIALCKMEK